MDRGAWRATIHRVTKSQTQLSDPHIHMCARAHAHTHTHTHTASVFYFLLLTCMPQDLCHHFRFQKTDISQAFINTSTFVFCIISPLPSLNIGLNLICLEGYSLTVLSSLPFISPRVFPSSCDC